MEFGIQDAVPDASVTSVKKEPPLEPAGFPQLRITAMMLPPAAMRHQNQCIIDAPSVRRK